MRIVAVADMHVAPPGTPGTSWHNPYRFATAVRRLRQAIEIADRSGADVLVALGDISHLGDDTTLRQVVGVLARARSPVWVVPGNHDSAISTAALAAALEPADHPGLRQAEALGQMHAGVRFAGAALDPAPGADHFDVVLPSTGHWGAELTFWLTHYPVFSAATRFIHAGFAYPGDVDNQVVVAGILRNRGHPTIVLNGHLHARDAVTEGAVLQISTAALIEPPFELTILDVEPSSRVIAVRTVALEKTRAARLPILVQTPATWVFGGGRWQRD